jgi:hypothetical protein
LENDLVTIDGLMNMFKVKITQWSLHKAMCTCSIGYFCEVEYLRISWSVMLSQKLMLTAKFFIEIVSHVTFSIFLFCELLHERD